MHISDKIEVDFCGIIDCSEKGYWRVGGGVLHERKMAKVGVVLSLSNGWCKGMNGDGSMNARGSYTMFKFQK